VDSRTLAMRPMEASLSLSLSLSLFLSLSLGLEWTNADSDTVTSSIGVFFERARDGRCGLGSARRGRRANILRVAWVLFVLQGCRSLEDGAAVTASTRGKLPIRETGRAIFSPSSFSTRRDQPRRRTRGRCSSSRERGGGKCAIRSRSCPPWMGWQVARTKNGRLRDRYMRDTSRKARERRERARSP